MIRVEKLGVRSGEFSLSDVDFGVPDGEYGVLMGSTGSGKTTLLEAICGLRSTNAGRILLGERDVTRTKPAERGIGYVPQDGALFEHLTVRDHLEFALRIRRWDRTSIARRVESLADLLGIGPLLSRRPRGLSGGERQRVALGRALSFRPAFLLMDEPLSALDEGTRREMCELLKQAQSESGVTALHVTHGRWEAEILADRFLELREGVVRQLEEAPRYRSAPSAV